MDFLNSFQPGEPAMTGAATSEPGVLAIEIERVGDEHVIRPVGELDLLTRSDLEQALLAAERGNARRIVVDLAGLGFIDSSGLNLLLQADARSRQDGDRLILRGGSSEIRRVFEIAGLSDRLPFVDDGAEPRTR